MSPRILRLPAVKEATGLSKATIYRFVKLGTFPQPIKLGPRAVAWSAEAVNAWVEAKIAAQSGKTPNAA